MCKLHYTSNVNDQEEVLYEIQRKGKACKKCPLNIAQHLIDQKSLKKQYLYNDFKKAAFNLCNVTC